MYSVDQDYETHIWQIIIRARYQWEVDATVGSLVVNAVEQVAPRALAGRVAEAAVAAMVKDEDAGRATTRSKVAALELLADWDGDLCPRFPWPRPHRDEVEEYGDPLLRVVLARASELVSRAGSEQLRGALGGVLAEGGARAA